MSSSRPKAAFQNQAGGFGGISEEFHFTEESRDALIDIVNDDKGPEFVVAVEEALREHHLQRGLSRDDVQRTNAGFDSLSEIAEILEKLSDAVGRSEGYGYSFLQQALLSENCGIFVHPHPARAAFQIHEYSAAIRKFEENHGGPKRKRPRSSNDDAFWIQIAYLYRSILDRKPGTGEKSPFVSVASEIAYYGALPTLSDMRGKLRTVRKRSPVEWGASARG